MKKLFFILFFIFTSIFSYTQSFIDKNFWQIHINETTNDIITDVFETDSFYYFYGLKNQYSAEAYPFILKVNNNGEIVKSEYYENELLNYFFCKYISIINDTLIIPYVYVNSNENLSYIGILKMNEELEILSKTQINTNYKYIWNSHFERINNKHFYWGVFTNDYQDYDIFINEIKENDSSNFKFILSETIDTIYRETFAQFKYDENKKKYIVLSYIPIIEPNNYRYTFITLNDSFKIESQKKIPSFYEKGQNIDYVKINNNYYFVGMMNYYTNPMYDMECLAISKIDSNFNEIKTVKYGYMPGKEAKSTVNQCLDTMNNFLYSGGTKNFSNATFFSTSPSWYSAVKVDTALNIVWEKYYGGDAYYHLWSIKATKDGGCLLIGSRYDYKTQNEERDPFIIKLDADGNPLSVKDLPQGFEVRNVLVYPNPGNAKLNYSCGIQETMLFEMYNMQGIKVISQTLYAPQGEIETTELPTGMYLYRFTTNKGCVQIGKWVKE